jgi:hypothetical protein
VHKFLAALALTLVFESAAAAMAMDNCAVLPSHTEGLRISEPSGQYRIELETESGWNSVVASIGEIARASRSKDGAWLLYAIKIPSGPWVLKLQLVASGRAEELMKLSELPEKLCFSSTEEQIFAHLSIGVVEVNVYPHIAFLKPKAKAG